MRTKLLSLKTLLVICLMAIVGGVETWADTYKYTFTSAVFKKTSTTSTENLETQKLGDVSWTTSGVIPFVAGYDADKGQQFGSQKKPANFSISTSDVNGTITSIKINASKGKNGSSTLAVSVGGNQYGKNVSLTKSATSYSFEGSSSGEVKISIKSVSIAAYIKSIEITYTSSSSSSVAAPTFSEDSKSFSDKFDLKLSAGSDAAKIMYTTDGSTPSSKNGVGELYEAPISITHSTTVKAIAVSSKGEESDVVTKEYKLELPAPIISEATKTFTAPFTVSLSTKATAAEAILYTLDGTDPSWENDATEIYTEPIQISATTTLKAVSYATNGSTYEYSPIASATYTYSQTYANLKELKANAENGKTYKVKLTDAIVTLTNGNNCYIEDATAGILYYKQKHGYIKGDKLNGVATVTYVVFNGTNEITSLEGDITKEADATIPCTTVTLSDILNNTAQYESMRVKVEMAVAKDIFKDNNDRNATIADGDLELPLFNGFAGSTYKEFRKNAYVNVTGYPYVYVNKASSTPTLKVWTGDIEAVKDDAVKITDAQYGTAYYADAFFMPMGATGYVAESNGNGGITLKETYAEGDLVPAKTALVLNAPKGNYDICLAESDAIAPTNNLLHGTTTEKLTEVEGGTYKYYKLSYNNEGNNLGFYWGSENGAAFINGAHKAYLALDSETLLSQSRGFSLADLAHGVTTGINTTIKSATQSTYIYDLNGRRINSLNGAAKGVYIMNGQKVLVK